VVERGASEVAGLELLRHLLNMDGGSVVIELEKPWRDPEGYRRSYLLEAKYEAELALSRLDSEYH
jgi:hypothetical protein